MTRRFVVAGDLGNDPDLVRTSLLNLAESHVLARSTNSSSALRIISIEIAAPTAVVQVTGAERAGESNYQV